MKKFDKYLDGLLIRGLVDVRKLAGVANAKRLPNGEMGFSLMCLNNSTLNLYDTNFKQEVGNLLTYEGFNYKLVDCVHKELYKAIKSEVL